eukprot:752984-Hanusia_phi.AAC.1
MAIAQGRAFSEIALAKFTVLWLAVLRVARTKKRLMWDGKTLQVARVVIRLTLEVIYTFLILQIHLLLRQGETEATFTADKQLLLRRAICSILNESVNCLLIRRVEQYKSDGERPQSRQEGEQEIAAGLEGEEQQEFAANKPVKVRVTMLALIPADRIKRFTVRWSEDCCAKGS